MAGVDIKKGFQWKIGQKLFAVFLILVLVPSILIGYFSYRSATQTLDVQLLNSANKQVENLSTIIDRVVVPIMKDTDVLARSLPQSVYQDMIKDEKTNLASNQQVQSTLKQFKAVHTDDTEVIGLATEDGRFAMEPQSPLSKEYDARTREWYTKAMEQKGQVIISKPYVSAASKNIVVSVAKTTDDGHGVAVVNLSLKKYVTDTVNVAKVGTQGFAFILDESQKVITHPTIAAGEVPQDDSYKSFYEQQSGVLSAQIDGKPSRIVFTTNKITGWKIAGVLYDSELDELKKPIITQTVGMIIISVLLSLVILYVINRIFVHPLKQMTRLSKQLAAGNLAETHITVKNRDELGDLAQAFNSLALQLRQLIEDLLKNAQNLNQVTDVLNSEVTEVANASSKIAEMNSRVTKGSMDQAQGISEISRTMQESVLAVSNFAEVASEIGEITEQTHQRAKEGTSIVSDSLNQMRTINSAVLHSSNLVETLMQKTMEIDNFATVINEIANQTNLLSLNASIEAARAGEHGRGFAVVAEEVKKLAVQSSDSATQITNLILEINKETKKSVESLTMVQQEVEDGLALSSKVETLLSDIIEDMAKINDEIQNLSSISEEVAAGSEEVSASVEDLSNIANSNSRDSSDTLSNIERQQESLHELMKQVKIVLDTAQQIRNNVQNYKLR
ncbi:methyl-accepting chemotaxis protein [Brevibacillus formosus]|uniref:methyl-accepting chemotaxis protein n=1 Tax=Brevibacillus formosus TaxID=54913 RepID=UPI003F1BBCE9